MTTLYIDAEITWLPAPRGAVTVSAYYAAPGTSAAERGVVKSSAAGAVVYGMDGPATVGRVVSVDDQRVEVLVDDQATVDLIRGAVYRSVRLTLDGDRLVRASFHDTIAARDLAAVGKVAWIAPDEAQRLARRAGSGDPEAIARLAETMGADRAIELLGGGQRGADVDFLARRHLGKSLDAVGSVEKVLDAVGADRLYAIERMRAINEMITGGRI